MGQQKGTYSAHVFHPVMEKYRRCRLFLCVADMLYFATKQLFAFLRDLAAEQSHLICTNDFLIYDNVKPSFLKCNLRFSSSLESSAYLKLTWLLV